MPLPAQTRIALPPPQSTLLVKTSSLGDVIHNLPVATDLRRNFPKITIDWVVEESFADIPRLHPAVRLVLPVALRRWRSQLFARDTRVQWRAFRQALDERHYDVILDTQGLVKSALIGWIARGNRCGYVAEAAREPLAARFYNRRFAIPRNLHAVDRNRWLAAAAFDYPPPDAADPSLDYGIKAQPLVAQWLPQRPYAVLLSATSRDDKLWAEERWVELGRSLAERGFTGGSGPGLR